MRTRTGVMAALALCLLATISAALRPAGGHDGYCVPHSAPISNICVLVG